jgi:molecular chaperone GrpE (heat shock protein)
VLEELLAVLYRPITDHLEGLMATVEELKTQLTEAKTSLHDAIARVEEDVENLKTQLADRIDPTALDPISQGLADLKAATDALDPDPANPPTEETTP